MNRRLTQRSGKVQAGVAINAAMNGEQRHPTGADHQANHEPERNETMIRKTILSLAAVAALTAAASSANAGFKVYLGTPYYGPSYGYCDYYNCAPVYYGYYGYNKHWKHYNKHWKHNYKHSKHYKKNWKH
jgi:hypothetical protein